MWVLWARTWNNRQTRLYKVTSKKAWQNYVHHFKELKANADRRGALLSETAPILFYESNDREQLRKMQELAQPLSKFSNH